MFLSILFLASAAHAQTLQVLAPNGGEELVAGEVARLEWSGPSTPATLSYSIDGGVVWIRIDTGIVGGRYDWLVPATPSNSCLFRVETKGSLATDTVRSFQAHDAFINSSTWSIDGTRFATSSDDNTVRIWDATTLKLVMTLVGNDGDVYWTSFSPDGTRIATASGDRTVRFWDARTGQQLLTVIAHTSGVGYISYNREGTRVVTASEDGTACILDPLAGTLLHTLRGHTSNVESAEFSPDGTQVVTTSRDGSVRIWDTSGIQLDAITGLTPGVNHAIYSADGEEIVTSGRDGNAVIWKRSTLSRVATLAGHTSWIWRTFYSPDGSMLATASRDHDAALWDRATGKRINVLKLHAGDVGSANFSPDGSTLLTSANDGRTALWRIGAGAISDLSDNVWSIVMPKGIRVLWPNGGETLVAGSNETIRWSGVLPGDRVRVEYTTDSLEGWNLIAEDVVGSTYLWKVPNEQGIKCLARVTMMSDAGNGDMSDAYWRISTVPLSVDREATSSASVSIEPNLVSNTMTIRFGGARSFRETSITIIDMLGRVVSTSSIVPGNGVARVDVGGIAEGAYICVIATAEGRWHAPIRIVR